MAVLRDLGASWSDLVVALVGGVGVYLTVVVLTRLAGVRALAKMSSFDFAATVAVGSIVATAALGSTPLVNAVLALSVLYGLQIAVAALRRRDLLGGTVDNRPVLLMSRGRFVEAGLRRTHVSRHEVLAQIRLAGVARLDDVHSVIMETTGDMSVLTGDGVDDELLANVYGARP